MFRDIGMKNIKLDLPGFEPGPSDLPFSKILKTRKVAGFAGFLRGSLRSWVGARFARTPPKARFAGFFTFRY